MPYGALANAFAASATERIVFVASELSRTIHSLRFSEAEFEESGTWLTATASDEAGPPE